MAPAVRFFLWATGPTARLGAAPAPVGPRDAPATVASAAGPATAGSSRYASGRATTRRGGNRTRFGFGHGSLARRAAFARTARDHHGQDEICHCVPLHAASTRIETLEPDRSQACARPRGKQHSIPKETGVRAIAGAALEQLLQALRNRACKSERRTSRSKNRNWLSVVVDRAVRALVDVVVGAALPRAPVHACGADRAG